MNGDELFGAKKPPLPRPEGCVTEVNLAARKWIAEVAASLTVLISFPMMFLGGSYFPTESAPAFLAVLALYLAMAGFARLARP